MLLEQKINELTDNKFGLMLKNATLNKKSGLCLVEFIYRDGVVLSPEARANIEKIAKELLPSMVEYQFKYTKNYVTNEAVTNFAQHFLSKQFPSIPNKIEKVDCEGKEKSLMVAINEAQIEYALNKGFKTKLEEALLKNFMHSINISVQPLKEQFEEVLIESESLVFESEPIEQRFIEVGEVAPVVGELTETLAHYIKDKKTPEEEVVFCGKLTFIKEFSYTPKRKTKENAKTDGDQEKIEEKTRKYYKFTLEDFTGKVSCTYFSNSKTEPLIAEFKTGDQLIISGKLEEDKFSGGVSLRVKNISRCVLPEKFEEEIIYKEVPENYRYVIPEPVEYYSQADLFSSEQKTVHEFFLNNDVVVYDFETTGKHVDGTDRIVEIGAVKLIQGKMVETFSCLVNPEMKIPKDATAIHGIVDDDVKDKHTYEEVLPDFYKFTHGCYLSGYNIDGFDNIYLTYFGKLCGYNFDNPSIDAFPLARKGIKGLKNYKLKTVAEHLNVPLDHAHRAVFDTMATAEVLLKLSEIMGKDFVF